MTKTLCPSSQFSLGDWEDSGHAPETLVGSRLECSHSSGALSIGGGASSESAQPVSHAVEIHRHSAAASGTTAACSTERMLVRRCSTAAVFSSTFRCEGRMFTGSAG